MSRRGRASSGLDGILLVDKPSGWTSHDVVARVRRISGQPRIGHTGTLDPAATGLLVLCLGQATRLVEYLTGHDKTYRGVVRLGVTTTTDDADGDVVARREVSELDDRGLEAALEEFRGTITQVPPAFSAVKIEGRRAYAVARAGEAPRLKGRTVRIQGLDGAMVGPDRAAIEVRCSAGTYIRSIARDLGRALGCGAHLERLRRTAAGRFTVEEAWSLTAIEEAGEGGIEALVLPTDEGVIDWPAAVLAERAFEMFAHGNRVEGLEMEPDTPEGALGRVFSSAGVFGGVCVFSASTVIQPVKVMLHMR